MVWARRVRLASRGDERIYRRVSMGALKVKYSFSNGSFWEMPILSENGDNGRTAAALAGFPRAKRGSRLERYTSVHSSRVGVRPRRQHRDSGLCFRSWRAEQP